MTTVLDRMSMQLSFHLACLVISLLRGYQLRLEGSKASDRSPAGLSCVPTSPDQLSSAWTQLDTARPDFIVVDIIVWQVISVQGTMFSVESWQPDRIIIQ